MWIASRQLIPGPSGAVRATQRYVKRPMPTFLLTCARQSPAKYTRLRPTSHQRSGWPAPEWDRWLACGNEAADTAAKAAYQDLPDLLRSTADAVASHCTEQSTLLKGFCKALVAVGLQDIKFRASAKAAAVVRPGPAEQDVATFLARFSNWQPPSGACRLPDHLEVDWVGWTFGVAFGDKLLDWLQVVKWPDQPVPPEFSGDISYMELLFHFTWFTPLSAAGPSTWCREMCIPAPGSGPARAAALPHLHIGQRVSGGAKTVGPPLQVSTIALLGYQECGPPTMLRSRSTLTGSGPSTGASRELA